MYISVMHPECAMHTVQRCNVKYAKCLYAFWDIGAICIHTWAPRKRWGDTACNVVSICVVCTICDALYCVVGFELVECMQEMVGIPEEW